MREWEVELIRKIEGEYKVIRAEKIKEFEDECLDYNLWAEAVRKEEVGATASKEEE